MSGPDDQNPYAAPKAAESRPVPGRPRWRYVPAAILLTLGGASAIVGVIAIAFLLDAVRTDTVQMVGESLGEMVACCVLYLGVGGCWLLSAYWFWLGHLRLAIAAAGLGALIPVALFSIMGF